VSFKDREAAMGGIDPHLPLRVFLSLSRERSEVRVICDFDYAWVFLPDLLHSAFNLAY